MVTEQDVFDHIMGAGAFTFPWWYDVEYAGIEGLDVHDFWSATIWVENPDDGLETIIFAVDHAQIMATLDVIANAAPEYVSRETVKQARLLLNDPDEADFDACTADEVLQVMAFGDVVYC